METTKEIQLLENVERYYLGVYYMKKFKLKSPRYSFDHSN